tara:strand:+ start:627 stop:1268 length:642 start_codon:yes stop_codon:yes gene_type:complete
MIIELFGLSKSGKTITASQLRQKGLPVINFENIPRSKKLFLFSNYVIKNPLTTIKLFSILNKNHISNNYKVWKMRNSYLASVLAKYNLIKDRERVFTEEFSFQSLFMILQEKASKEEISKTINLLPKSDMIFFFERPKEQRHKIYEKPHPTFKNPSMYPGGWISKEYAKKWMENSEYNHEIIKEIIKEKYKEDPLNLPKLSNNPKIYSPNKSL